MRRTLTILALIVVLVGLGVAAYFYFFADDASITTAPGKTSTSLPTAEQSTVVDGGDTEQPETPASLPTVVSARLVQISAGPVVPGEVVTSTAGNASTSPEAVVTYIERQSGNVYAYSTLAKTLTRTSNRTIPGIQSASWLPDASLAFVRYLSGDDSSTINTYALPANGTGGFFLSQNLADISVSSDSVLTLASGVNGSIISSMRTDGTRSTELFTTPLSALRLSFAGKSQYLVYTKASGTLPGNAFLADSAGRLSRVAGPLNGLVALASPSGKWVLASYTRDGAMQMMLVSTATGESLSLPVATIADKCVWAGNDASVYCGVPVRPPPATYPDDWYQGAAHFSDRIWKIDVASRYAQLVLDFSTETESALDAFALATDPAGTTLVFVNKNDSSLWAYSL